MTNSAAVAGQPPTFVEVGEGATARRIAVRAREGAVGRGRGERVAVFGRFCRGPQVVIGSSRGGWMALLLAREIARRAASPASLAGLVLIAPAPDFTEQLMC